MRVIVTEYLVRNNQDFPGHICPVYPGRTASGVYVRVGMAASDWSVFPRGTKIQVPHFPHGVVTVTDTGGMIIGKHIDLAVASCREALTWGRRILEVQYHRP